MNKYAAESRVIENRMCWRKKKHATEDEITIRYHGNARAYQCPHCGEYHATSQPERKAVLTAS